jgi:hypothetical protein
MSSTGKRILSEIKDGNDNAVERAAKSYFPVARKLLRMKGVRDDQTPHFFANSFVRILSELRKNKISEHSDFSSLLNNYLIREAAAAKTSPVSGTGVNMETIQTDVVAQCTAILDDDSRKLLFLRFAERKSYEEIAVIFNFSNPVIAQFETEKAYRQLEGIVKVRFNMSQN